MRIVFDTNVLISASLFEKSLPRQAVKLALETASLITSSEARDEVLSKIYNSKFDRYASKEKRLAFLEPVLEASERIFIVEKITVCRDKKDNMFLELAVSGKADFIVSGDKDLLVLNPFRGIPILSAAEFLERVRL